MKKFDAINNIRVINQFRIATENNAFSKAELKEVLKTAKFPSNDVFINELRRRPFVKQVGKDQFKFSDQPICYEWINDVYQVYKSKTDKYKKTYQEKKKQNATFLTY